MSVVEPEPNRRKHARAFADVGVGVAILGDTVPIGRLIDVSVGGLLVELRSGAAPPALNTRGTATITKGAASLERKARVIRVRWKAREKGTALPAAVALVLDDSDDDAAARLEELLR